MLNNIIYESQIIIQLKPEIQICLVVKLQIPVSLLAGARKGQVGLNCFGCLLKIRI